jgi:Trypsin-like peptidase domain
MKSLRHCVALLLIQALSWSVLSGRDWHSADGKHTITADFGRVEADKLWLKNFKGKDSEVPLALLSKDDAAMAQTMQRVADAAAKVGPCAFEISHVIGDLWLCRMGRELASQKGLIVYTGDSFVLHPTKPKDGEPGKRLKVPVLYPATQREFHPVKGSIQSITEYTLGIEQAAELNMAWATTPTIPVFEPIIENIEAVGIGYVVARGGYILVEADFIKEADSIILHVGKVDSEGAVVATDEELGLALLSCKAASALEPLRFTVRKPLELGQSIYAISLGNGNDRKTFGEPTMTKGIVSNLSGASAEGTAFQHDAALPEQRLGVVALSDKGDTLGLVAGAKVKPKSKGRISAATKAKAAEASATAPALGTCLRFEAISQFLQTIPGLPALRSGSSNDLGKSVDALRHSIVLVSTTREVRHDPTPPQKSIASKTSAQSPNVVPGQGFSLSKSGTRHNAKCRYFNAQLPCAATDGSPCKICGG